MKTKVDIDDFRTIIYWVTIFLQFEKKEMKYPKFVDIANSISNEPIDIKVYPIDELMVDAYNIYIKLKKVSNNVDMLDMFNIESDQKKEVVKETTKYFDVFQDLIENYKYNDAEIRAIQQGILNDKMSECIKVEDYENAAKYRDLIKES